MPIANAGFETEGTPRGTAGDWTHTESSDERHATFADGGQPAINEPPFEDFRGEWGGNEAFVATFAGIGVDLESAVYGGVGDTPLSYDGFDEGWGNGAAAFVSASNASYDGRAFVESVNSEPFALVDGVPLVVTTSAGAAASDESLGTGASVTGTAGNYPTGFVRDNVFRLTIDDNTAVAIDLTTAQNLADIIGIINVATGYDVASDDGGELRFSSELAGNGARVHLEEIRVARSIATNPSPYALSDGDTLQIEIDGGATIDVTFSTADFGDIAAATADEVAAVITATLADGEALSRFGLVEVYSQSLVGSMVAVVGGTAAGAFDFPALAESPLRTLGLATVDELGTGNVRDLDNVSAQEIANIINGTVDLQLVFAEARVRDGHVLIYDTVPETGTVAIGTGDFADALGSASATAAATGITADTEEDFEEQWTNDAYRRAFESADLVELAQFDGEDVEAFESGWKSNETFLSALGASEAAFYDTDPITTLQQVEDFNEVRFDREFYVNASTDVFTSAGHLLINNIVLVTLRSEGGNLPSGLEEGIRYVPTVIDSDTFQLSETVGGPVVDVEDIGSGTLIMKYSLSAFWTEELAI